MIERPSNEDDLPAVVELFCRYETRFRGFPDTEPSDVSDDWGSPEWDFAECTRVLEQDGRVVGYGLVVEEHADTVVDVDLDEDAPWERLLAWVEAHPKPMEHYVPDGDARLNRLLPARGWVPARRFWRMRIELDAPTPEPAWPSDVLVREYRRPDDDRPVHELITTSFREIGGQHERPFEQWCGFLLDSSLFDPSLYLVVEHEGRIVGAALSQATGDYGYVRQLAVAPSHRGRGLAHALLLECFRRHRERGMPATALGVDAGNPTGALALYEKAGMRVHEEFTRYDWTP